MMSSPLRYGIAPPSYRLPDATRVGTVRLQVADLSRSIDYYSEVIGLQVTQTIGSRAWLAAHGDDTPLVELHARARARPAPRQGRLGLFHFAILVPERATLGRVVRHIADRGVYAGSADHAVSEALYLTDPDGLGIEIYADRPRATWRLAGQELYLTTEPLDLHDLVRQAGDAPWAGLPSGTTMGHIHLHVGALDDSAAFYHAALGFDQIVWSYPGALFLSAGGYHHHLGTNTWAVGAEAAHEGEARLLEWDLVLPDEAAVEGTARSLHDHGYASAVDGADRLARDPWGTAVRLRATAARLER